MTEPTTLQLKDDIELKDKRFRVAQGVFMIASLLVLIAVIFVQLRTLAGVQEQLKQQGVLLEEQRKNTEELKATTANVSKQLDCIAQFFATRDRATATITDLEQCTIVKADGSIVNLTLPQRSGQTNQSQQTPRVQQQQPVTISPTTPGLTPLNPQQPEVPVVPPTNPVPDPVEILGIPICVPFTGLCVR